MPTSVRTESTNDIVITAKVQAELGNLQPTGFAKTPIAIALAGSIEHVKTATSDMQLQ
ncbi:hypothetical protein [Chitinivorax sp. B]|uniref:hypothetical protein n=1 Tax=Chitinivorax sp. B TaxID=2502235 RepID=UPI001485AD8F|nr:hypothetical protein [Chitinivorax sp. B]